MYYNAVETGKRIQELRKEAGLTQAGLAEQLHISMRHLQKLECGERGGSIEALVEISLFFHVTLDYLILGRLPTAEVKLQLREIAGCLEKISATL